MYVVFDWFFQFIGICSYVSCFLIYHVSYYFCHITFYTRGSFSIFVRDLLFSSFPLTLYAPTPENGQTLKQFVGKLLANCLSVFDHFVGLALKGLNEKLVNKRRSCCWNITWLDIYLAILVLLSSCYLLLLPNQNQPVCLFLFHIPTKFLINKKKTFLSGDLFVVYNVMLWNISFPGWRFPTFYGL